MAGAGGWPRWLTAVPAPGPAPDWRPSPKSTSYVALAVAACVAALVTGSPGVVAMAVPFVVLVAVGLAAPRPQVSLGVTCDRSRLSEGEKLEVLVSVESAPGRAYVLFNTRPGPGFAPSGPGPGTVPRPRSAAVGLELGPGGRSEHCTALVARRWGKHQAGTVVWQASSYLGAMVAGGELALPGPVAVYPRPEVLRRLVLPQRLVLPWGAHVSRAKGQGYELAGVRPYRAGDRARDVNWRAWARHRQLASYERHPYQGADVVLLLDTFDGSSLDRAVTAACALAESYLGQRDRVGLVKFGGWLRWLRPGLGERQWYAVVDALLGTEVAESAVYRGLDVLPPRTVPPASLLVALTTLEGVSSVPAMVDLVDRGLDLVVLEVEPPVGRAPLSPRLGAVAEQLWLLTREANRAALRRAGAPTVVWRQGRPLAEALEELAAVPRGARLR